MKPWTKAQKRMINTIYGLVVGSIALWFILTRLAPPLITDENGLVTLDAIFIGGMSFAAVGLARPDWAKQLMGWALRFKHHSHNENEDE